MLSLLTEGQNRMKWFKNDGIIKMTTTKMESLSVLQLCYGFNVQSITQFEIIGINLYEVQKQVNTQCQILIFSSRKH